MPQNTKKEGSDTLRRSRGDHDDVVEFTLLLSAEQAGRLEKVAKRQGMTTARLLRQLIADLISNEELTETESA